MKVTLRPCEATDVTAINCIHRYYIENSLVTFILQPLSDHDYLGCLNTRHVEGLPFVVAIDQATSEVVGYAYLSQFGNKDGYQHTTELSLYVDVAHQAKGTGTQLLNHIIEIAKKPTQFPQYFVKQHKNIAVILSIMSVDVDDGQEGSRLPKYYEKFGFQQTGRLKKVGRKFGRWLDVIYAQLELPLNGEIV